MDASETSFTIKFLLNFKISSEFPCLVITAAKTYPETVSEDVLIYSNAEFVVKTFETFIV